MTLHRPQSILLAIAACLLALTACGAKKESNSSQVVATVNRGEISAHQLNFALQQRPDFASLGASAPGQMLNELIDQEVAVQAAFDAKLDREPAVLLALEAGRRNILASLYLQRTTESAAKPTSDEVARYYAENPALFKQRRVYVFQELDIEMPQADVPALDAQLRSLKSAQAVSQAITASGLRYTAQQGTRMAEALPLELLDQVAALSEGQTAVMLLPQGARAMTLVSSMPAPVTEVQARPVIEQFLLSNQRRLAALAQMKALRDKAEIRISPAVTAAAPRTAP